jgi:hypothetical protein
MRRIASAAVVLSLWAAAAAADEIAWPGQGVVGLAVPRGWTMSSRTSEHLCYLRAVPRSGAAVSVQISVLALPPDKPMRAEQVRGMLEDSVRPHLADSLEKELRAEPVRLGPRSGWMVQLTDAALAGKPAEPGNSKVMRSAMAAIDEHVIAMATVLLDDPAVPEVREAMTLLSTLRFERSAGADPPPAPAAGRGLDFTVPESRILLRMPAIGLEPKGGPRAGAASNPGYFHLARREPMLIVSGWLEPASRYSGLKAFWDEESRSPAYAGAGAPRKVDFLREGAWEVVAFEIPLAGAVSVHVRAERVEAGTWIDLHLSTTDARAAEALRGELLEVLRSIRVVEK